MEHFYFTAQTGTIHTAEPQSPSNYHRYCLPVSALDTVQKAVDAARVEDSGLVYPATFLAWISKIDRRNVASDARHRPE